MKTGYWIFNGALAALVVACNGLTGSDDILIVDDLGDDSGEADQQAGAGGYVPGAGSSASASTTTAGSSTTQSASSVAASSSSVASSAVSSSAVSSSAVSSSAVSSSSSGGPVDCLSDPNAKKQTAYLCISGVD